MGLPALKEDLPKSLFMADPKKDGERIRLLMRERGFTQEAFAEKLGLSQSMVSKLLTGRAAWISTHWNKAAEILQVSPRELHADVTDEDRLVGGIVALKLDKGTRQKLEWAARRYGQVNEFGKADLQAVLKFAIADFLKRHESEFSGSEE